MSAMLRIFTPIVAQSSEDASLTTTGTDAVCDVVLDVVDPEEPPPPPQATSAAATPAVNALHMARLTRMTCITLPSKLLVFGLLSACPQQRGGSKLVDARYNCRLAP